MRGALDIEHVGGRIHRIAQEPEVTDEQSANFLSLEKGGPDREAIRGGIKPQIVA